MNELFEGSYALIKFLVIAAVIAGVAAIMTKPSDQECYDRVGGQLGQLFPGITRAALRIEDHTFYKTIYYPFSERPMGCAYFGTVQVY